MATTKQVLRLQSDQTLDDPQIATRVRLKDLTASRAIHLVWTEPATSDWDIEFKDPTANDAVVYENLPQTLTNKTLTAPTITDFTNAQHTHSAASQGGLVSHAALTNLTLGDHHTQYALLAGRSPAQTLRGGTAASENLTLESTSHVTKGTINVLDSVVVSSTKNITVSGGGELLGLPPTPSGATAAASKAYVDASVAGGASWRETLLSSVQLDSTNNAIAQAVAFYLVNNPSVGNTLTIKDGATTETFTFQAVSGAFQPAIGGTPLITMQNLASRITTDSTAWSASAITTLQGINPVGNVVVIYRKVPTASPVDRIYGTFTVPADAKYVNYGGTADYRDSTTANLPSVDPATANFGFSRVTSGLTPAEAHIVRAEDSAYLWNDDLGVWQLSAGAVALATSGSGGGTVGQATYDSDKGLLVSAGVVEVRVDGSTINFTGGQLSVAGGAVPVATSAPGGGTQGKVSADEDYGLEIVTGNLRAKVDGTSISFNLSGELSSSGAPLAPTGDVSHGILLTRDIPLVASPTPGFISSDIPVLSYPDGSTTGQMFDFVVPADYDSGSVDILVSYQMSTAFPGDIVLETQCKIVRASTGVVDTATFPAVSATVTPPGTTNLTRLVIKTLVNPSGTNFQRGDTLQVYVKRLGADGADTHTGNWVVTAFEYRYTGQIYTRLMEPVADAFTPVSGEATPAGGFFSVDIPTIDYSDAVDQAAACRFVVPENWDGAGDVYLRVQYAMAGAAGGTVRLRTAGNIANVSTGSVSSISTTDFDVATTADTNPHRSLVIRSIAGSTLSKGSVIEVSIKRITAVGGNNPSAFKLINATMAFGVTPTSGVAVLSDYYLGDGTFGNASGSVTGDTTYPDFSTDFELFYSMSSTSAAGVLHVAFEGRLESSQTTVNTVSIFVKGLGGSPQYNLKIYAEGSGATPVYASGVTAAPGASTQVVVSSGSMSAQPTGSKRFFVVVESSIDAGETVLVSRPFVKVT